MGLRDQILAKTELPREEVQAWGVTLWVRTLTGTERDAFEAASVQGKGKERQTSLVNFRARLAVLCCCDEEGKRIFEDMDVVALGRTSAKDLDRVTDIALRLNGMKGEESVEQEEKNLSNGRS